MRAARAHIDGVNFTTDSTGLRTGATAGNGMFIAGQRAVNLFIACNNPAASYFRPFQGVGNILNIENSRHSSDNSLQATARRRFGDLFWGKRCLESFDGRDSSDHDDRSFANSYDLKGSRARSNFHIRQNASFRF